MAVTEAGTPPPCMPVRRLHFPSQVRGGDTAPFLSAGKGPIEILANSFLNCELALSPSTHKGLYLPLLLEQTPNSH